MTNDHGFDVRVLIHTTNRYGVPSFYLQHASVTEDFPKLEMTYALLEGKDAKDKYLKNGSDPEKIHLIGMIKYDRYINQINKSTNICTIGYAINATENEEKLIDDLNYLIQHFSDMKIILRPHPWQYTYMIRGRLTKILQRIVRADNFSISDPRKESAFDFLGQIDLLISGDSSIHLEAVLVNVMSIYYDNQGKAVDHYGYLKNGVAFGARDLNQLIEIINTYKNNRPYVKDKAKPYVDTINTPFEGKSSQLAINIIEEKLAV
jgi:predicted glycosyltransferase